LDDISRVLHVKDKIMQSRDFSGDYGGQAGQGRGGLRGRGGYLVVVMVVMLAIGAELLNSFYGAGCQDTPHQHAECTKSDSQRPCSLTTRAVFSGFGFRLQVFR